LGENHFKTADCYQKIAQGLIKLKQYDEAPKLLDNALAIYSKIADKDYRVATIYLLKSEISLDKENYIESFDLCQKGLNIVKEKRDLSSSQLIPFNT
jgi:tetratricopeptide (TPR) repeat protein